MSENNSAVNICNEITSAVSKSNNANHPSDRKVILAVHQEGPIENVTDEDYQAN